MKHIHSMTADSFVVLIGQELYQRGRHCDIDERTGIEQCRNGNKQCCWRSLAGFDIYLYPGAASDLGFLIVSLLSLI